MKIFFRLLGFSRPYHHYIPEYIVYIFFFIVFGLVNFTLLAPLLDILFNTGHTQAQAIDHLPSFSLSASWFKDAFYYYVGYYSKGPAGKVSVLIFVSIITLICTLLKNIFGFLATKVLTRMRVNMVKKMRHLIYEQYSHVRAYEPILNNAPLETLHALRIELKRFRYAIEAFEDVLGSELKTLLDATKALQEHLGDLQDARVAVGLLNDYLKRQRRKLASAEGDSEAASQSRPSGRLNRSVNPESAITRYIAFREREQQMPAQEGAADE